MFFQSFEAKVQLRHCHRQKDGRFIELLDNLSVGESTVADYEILRARVEEL